MDRAKIELASGDKVRGRIPASGFKARHLLSICEDCGKKYRVDINKIRGRAAAFSCRSCGHQVIVTRPKAEIPGSRPAFEAMPSMAETLTLEDHLPEMFEPSTVPLITAGLPARPRRPLGRIGLRVRLVLIFLVLPVGIMAGAGFLFQRFFEYRIFRLSQESHQLANQSAEEHIAGVSAAIAAQTKLYLHMRPDLSPQDFERDAVLRDIVLQSVGKTGFAFLYERPVTEGAWRARLHEDSQWLGADLSTLRKELGAHFPGFWEIVTGVREGRLSRGYCYGRERNGKFREKFMACTPIVDTPYVIAASAYMEEFSGPSSQMETRIAEFKADTRMLTLGGLGGAFLLSLFAMWACGLRLAGRFRSSAESDSGEDGGGRP